MAPKMAMNEQNFFHVFYKMKSYLVSREPVVREYFQRTMNFPVIKIARCRVLYINK